MAAAEHGPAPAGPEGEIRLTLRLQGGRVVACGIASSRPDVAGRLLRGRSVADILALVPRLYSVCGQSQGLAAELACAAALGARAGDERLAQCRAVLAAEALRETALRVLLHWPRALGEAPEAVAVAAARAVRSVSAAGAPGAAPQGLDEAGREAIALAAFGRPARHWLALQRAGDFDDWAASGATAAARVVGAPGEPGEPPLRLLVRSTAMFERAGPEETGALSRLQGDPLVQALQRAGVGGARLRFAARLRELALLLLGRAELGAGNQARPDGEGVAWVENARGLLVHRLRLHQGRAESYAIVAPTDRNFHPEGALAAALAGSQAGDPDALRRRAQRLVDSLDPCVDCRIEVELA